MFLGPNLSKCCIFRDFHIFSPILSICPADMKVRCVVVDSCSTSLPGGNQVDGLPPASHTPGSSVLRRSRFSRFGPRRIFKSKFL